MYFAIYTKFQHDITNFLDIRKFVFFKNKSNRIVPESYKLSLNKSYNLRDQILNVFIIAFTKMEWGLPSRWKYKFPGKSCKFTFSCTEIIVFVIFRIFYTQLAHYLYRMSKSFGTPYRKYVISNMLCVNYIHRQAGDTVADNLEFQEDYKKMSVVSLNNIT